MRADTDRKLSVSRFEAPPLFLIVVLAGLSQYVSGVIAPALIPIQQDLGPLASQAIPISLLGLAIGQLAFGALSDRIGRRPAVVYGLIIALVGAVAALQSSGQWAFLIARFVEGFGISAGIICARASSRDTLSDGQLVQRFAIIGMVLAAAPALAPVVGGMISQLSDWRLILGASSVIILWALIASLRLYPETLSSPATKPHSEVLLDFVDLLRARQFIFMCAANGFALGGVFAIFAGGPIVLAAAGLSSQFGLGLALASGPICAVISGGFVAAKASRLEPIGVIKNASMLLLLCGLGLALLLLSSSNNLSLLIFGFAVYGALLGVLLPLIQSLALAPYKASSGGAGGLLGAIQMALGAFGGSLAAIGAGFSGFITVLLMFPLLVAMFARLGVYADND